MIDLDIRHHFSSGVYAKQMHIKKDCMIGTHKHKFDHMSILGKGVAIVETDDAPLAMYFAPACIEIKAGVEHRITAVEDVTWFCIHATDETDADNIDETLIEED